MLEGLWFSPSPSTLVIITWLGKLSGILIPVEITQIIRLYLQCLKSFIVGQKTIRYASLLSGYKEIGCSNNEIYSMDINKTLVYPSHCYSHLSVVEKISNGSNPFSQLWVFGNHFYKTHQLNLTITKIQCGYYFTILVDICGNVYSFGWNFCGQCGLPETQNIIETPTKICLEKSVQEISCGENHTCCMDIEQQLWFFGDNNCGQLGIEEEYQSVFNPFKHRFADNFATTLLDCGKNCTIFGIKYHSVYMVGYPIPSDGSGLIFRSSHSPILLPIPNICDASIGPLKGLFVSSVTRSQIWGFGINTNGEVAPSNNQSYIIDPYQWNEKDLTIFPHPVFVHKVLVGDYFSIILVN